MTPQELKSSILQLAIQGKLVEQRPEEGTGEELYRQIQKEKQERIKAGKIKKEKPFSKNTNYEEYPFDIPESWIFVRFGELMINRDSERVPVSTSERSKRAKIYDYYGASGVIDRIDDYLFDKELLLIGEDGANLLARSTPIAFLASGQYWVNNHAHVLDGCSDLDLRYIGYFINAISLAPYVTGTAQPKMNQENMNAIWVPLPPLAEQKRIVAKIEELLPYIDRYEKAWSRLEELNKRFPVDMQKSILQMAIQGKLVEQRPEEGTGEELYRQIQAEKQKLIKEGKIKKGKPLPEISEDEIPFDIPESWKWVRLNEIISVLGDGIHGTPAFDEMGDYYFVNGNNLAKGHIVFKADTKKASFDEYEKHKKPLDGNTILISINGTIGNYAFYAGEPIILGKSACYFSVLTGVDKEYVRHIINTKFFMDYAVKEATQTTIKNVSLKAMRMLPVPLPPLAEQKRIVAKLGEILPLCERSYKS